MERKAVYIGAGLDLKIIKKLDFIKKFVFIDSQPFSEFGKLQRVYNYDYYYYFQNIFLSHIFPCFFRKNNGFHRKMAIPRCNTTVLIAHYSKFYWPFFVH